MVEMPRIPNKNIQMYCSYTFWTYFGGNIGQIIQYNRALNSTELTQNFNATKTRFGL